MKIVSVNCRFFSHTIWEGLHGKKTDVVNYLFFLWYVGQSSEHNLNLCSIIISLVRKFLYCFQPLTRWFLGLTFPLWTTERIYRVIQNDVLNWTVIGASTRARQLVAVFQVLCSLYGLTCVGYAQNSLEFVSHSPLIHAKILMLHSSHFALNWRCCKAVR